MKACRSIFLCALLPAMVLLGDITLAQDSASPPAPRINRNPEYRDSLPPAPPVETDPRDSTTRPVLPPELLPADGRSVVVTPAAPEAPASAPQAPQAPRVPASGAAAP